VTNSLATHAPKIRIESLAAGGDQGFCRISECDGMDVRVRQDNEKINILKSD